MPLTGGRRRTVNLPCGKIFRGPQKTLGSSLRLHGRVCLQCEELITPEFVRDMCCSEPTYLNQTNFRGGGICSNKGGVGIQVTARSVDGEKVSISTSCKSGIDSSIKIRKDIEDQFASSATTHVVVSSADDKIELSKSQKKRAQRKRAKDRKDNNSF